VALIVLSNTVGNLLLAISMTRMPSFASLPLHSYVTAFIANPFFIGGTCLSALSLLSQLTMYTWADLSFVMPVTASGYVVTAIFSKLFLQEHVSIFRWIGVVIISFGVFFVAETPSDTKHHESEQLDAQPVEEASQ